MGYIDKNGITRFKKVNKKDASSIVENGNFHFKRLIGTNMDILINEDETQWFIFESLH